MRFRRVLIATASLGALQAFYEDLLELPVAASSAHVAVEVGETELVFQSAPPGTAPSYHFAFRIPGDQFRDGKRWLGDRAVLLRYKGKDEVAWDFWDAMAVYTRDPAGTILELLAFRGLAESTQPFTSASLLGLAELGLPVHDVKATVAQLTETFAISLWDRQQPAPDGITPLGQRGASFIVATLGRPWFLGPASGDYPLQITLEGVRQGELQLPGQPIYIRADTSSSGA